MNRSQVGTECSGVEFVSRDHRLVLLAPLQIVERQRRRGLRLAVFRLESGGQDEPVSIRRISAVDRKTLQRGSVFGYFARRTLYIPKSRDGVTGCHVILHGQNNLIVKRKCTNSSAGTVVLRPRRQP